MMTYLLDIEVGDDVR